MISFVARKSPAKRGGFIAGDIILQINGKDIKPGDQVLPLRHLLRDDKINRHTFLIDREGRNHNLTLELQDLFMDY